MQPTEWTRIPGFSRYEITKSGLIRNAETGRIRKISLIRGYPALLLVDDAGAKKHPYLHTLLLVTFVRAKKPGEVCRHLDGNKLNHDLSNLKWGTETENMYDMVRHGQHFQVLKTHCPQGHPYDEHNTYVLPSRPTARYCKECNRISGRQRAARARENSRRVA